MAAFHSLTDFKSITNFKDTVNDTVLTLLQTRVYQRIQNYTGRFFEKKERTEEVRIKGELIPLKAIPIDSSESITATIIADFSEGESYTTLAASEYEVTNYGLKLANPLTSNEKIRVIYTGGYAVTDGVLVINEDDPASIAKEAAIIQLTHEWNKRNKPGADTITTDLGTIKEAPLELLADVRNMLTRVRHPRMFWFG